MTDSGLVVEDSGLIPNFLSPGMRVWIRVRQIAPGKRGAVEQELVFGDKGELTYQGYAQVSNAIFLVFDRSSGVGKRAQIERLAVHAAHCPFIGPYGGGPQQ